MDIIQSLGVTDFSPLQNPNYCAECNYTGFVIDPITNSKKNCACLLENKRKQLFKLANIPSLYWGKTIQDDWNIKQDGKGNDLGTLQKKSASIRKFLIWYIQNIDNLMNNVAINLFHSKNKKTAIKNLLLHGGYGSGKTFIASVLAQEVIKAGYSVKFYSWTELVYHLNQFQSAELDQLFEDFKKTNLICIDSIKSYDTKSIAFELNFDRLIVQRALTENPTIITTSKSLGELTFSEEGSKFLRRCFMLNLPTLNEEDD